MDAIKEYFVSMGRWGWFVLAEVIGSVAGGILDVWTNVNIPTPIWFSFLIAGLVVAPFLAFNNLRKDRNLLRSQLDSIKTATPNIQVEPEVTDSRFSLVVRNIGGKGGLFTASGKIIDGKPSYDRYVMYWEGLGEKCQINGKGGLASILVAEKAPHTILREAETSIYEGELSLFRWGTSGEQTFPIHTYSKRPTAIDGKEGFEIITKDKCILEITVTSDPPLLEEFVSHKFALEIDHENEDVLLFSEV